MYLAVIVCYLLKSGVTWATCSSSSGLPITLLCISLISCWYSLLRCSSCLLQRIPVSRAGGATQLAAGQVLPELLEFALVGLRQSQARVVGLGPLRHHPLQLLLSLPLLFSPALLLLLSLLPLFQRLPTQENSLVTKAEGGGQVGIGWGQTGRTRVQVGVGVVRGPAA